MILELVNRRMCPPGYTCRHVSTAATCGMRTRLLFCTSMSETKRITEDDVRHVARLSRLHLEEDELRLYTRQLGSVLDYIAKIGELDVSDVEPMAHALDLTNVLRDDTAQPGLPVEQMLQNAPQRSEFDDMHFFKVPKVLGEGPGA